MSIKNTRKSIVPQNSDERLKAKLREAYGSFQEAEGDEPADEDMDIDFDTDTADVSEEGEQENSDSLTFDDLSANEQAQVDHWIEELLQDSLDTVDLNSDDSLDVETSSDDLDPMGQDEYIHADLPMTTEELEDIINNEESYKALTNSLANIASELGDDEGLDMDVEDDLEGGLEGDEDSDLEGFDFDSDEDNELEEAEDPMKGMDDRFKKQYQGKDVKDELAEDVDLAKDNKDLGFEKTKEGLNDKITSTVTPTPGARSKESLEADVAKKVQESYKKSKMLVSAAAIAVKQRNIIDQLKESIQELKLENYRLLKNNGLLSIAGDVLNKETRTQITEGFDKCKTVDQVNKFYDQLTKKIETATRGNLNEAVGRTKTRVNQVREEKQEQVSHEQMRKNFLMGLQTEEDMYYA